MANKELQRELVDKLFDKYQLRGKISTVELSDDYNNPKGIKGYEKNTFYLFNGIRVISREGKEYVFMRGDVWELPRKEIPNHSYIQGFEININQDKSIEDSYFVTRCAYTFEELKQSNYNVYNKMVQVKIDQK